MAKDRMIEELLALGPRLDKALEDPEYRSEFERTALLNISGGISHLADAVKTTKAMVR